MSGRRGLPGLFALAATAIATAAPPDPAVETKLDAAGSAIVAESAPTRGKAVKATPHLEVERLSRLRDAAEAAKEAPAAKVDVTNVFASTSWYVPPPPPKVEPPPKPTAPPLPFTFLGRYEDPRRAVVVMLTKGDRLYTVTVGDVIDDTYRVDRITEKTVELTYLPLQTKQSLPAGGA